MPTSWLLRGKTGSSWAAIVLALAALWEGGQLGRREDVEKKEKESRVLAFVWDGEQ